MQYTLEDVLDFSWRHKGKRCFKDMTYAQVAMLILHASKFNKMLLVEDEGGICGTAILRVKDKVVYVDYLVAVRNGFKTFVKYFHDNFPGYSLWAQRKGKNVTINSRILCQQLRRN